MRGPSHSRTTEQTLQPPPKGMAAEEVEEALHEDEDEEEDEACKAFNRRETHEGAPPTGPARPGDDVQCLLTDPAMEAPTAS